jgi:hypothetical protein
MKLHKTKRLVVIFALLIVSANFLRADPELQGRQPTLDSLGRFWVYRNGATHPKMPFTPYGWMSDATNLSQVVEVDVESRDHPNTITKTSPPERDRCIRIKLTWSEATWASVAFISGPDKPPWWGDSNTGRYYNLNVLPKKKLIFYARGDKGGEVIKAQIGALGDKPFGDSLANPITSESLKLTPDWTRYEIDLKNAPPSELEKICNGFGIVAERASQAGSPGETQFYIDDIYFE